jgi:hypothetical protein
LSEGFKKSIMEYCESCWVIEKKGVSAIIFVCNQYVFFVGVSVDLEHTRKWPCQYTFFENTSHILRTSSTMATI